MGYAQSALNGKLTQRSLVRWFKFGAEIGRAYTRTIFVFPTMPWVRKAPKLSPLSFSSLSPLSLARSLANFENHICRKIRVDQFAWMVGARRLPVMRRWPAMRAWESTFFRIARIACLTGV
jgi:hypothetical protein